MLHNAEHIKHVLSITGGYYGNKYIIQALYEWKPDKMKKIRWWHRKYSKRLFGIEDNPCEWAICEEVTVKISDDRMETYPTPIDDEYYTNIEDVVDRFIQLDGRVAESR